MDHRKALKFSTDRALGLLVLACIGILLWVVDEVLLWDILPDWLEACAVAAVIVAGTLTAFCIVASFMCSAAVAAESLAAHAAGEALPPPRPHSRRLKLGILALGLLAALLLYGFHRIDVVRARRAVEASRAEDARRYYKTRDELKARIPEIVQAFTPEMVAGMARLIEPEGEQAISEMLQAIHSSSPGNPAVSLMVKAEAPYLYQVVRGHGAHRDLAGRVSYLGRTPLIDLPSVWERDTVAAIFQGAERDVPHGRSGAFIDTRMPCAWGMVRHEGDVVGIVLLRGDSYGR
jgi:hypothetical protein